MSDGQPHFEGVGSLHGEAVDDLASLRRDVENLEDIDKICSLYEVAWEEWRSSDSAKPELNEYLADTPFRLVRQLLPELVRVDVEQRQNSGERTVARREYFDRFPEYHDVLIAVLAELFPDETKWTGRRVGDYQLESEVSEGGMGVVYRARHLKLNRTCALKVIRSRGRTIDDDVARFQKEAEAIARLQHPNIVVVYETGEHEGEHFLAMEYCDGGTLHDRLRDTPIAPSVAAELCKTLALAVHAAHTMGIIHRDLKPANVLFDANGDPKLSDFGLAKFLDDTSEQTQTGQVMGTPSYMAPEQAQGRSTKVEPTVDVYSLGAILYECLTGRAPFKGASVLDTLEQIRNHEPVPVRRLQPNVPRDLETICLKCLQKNPASRYGSAQELADDLVRYVEGKPVVARPTGRRVHSRFALAFLPGFRGFLSGCDRRFRFRAHVLRVPTPVGLTVAAA